jgi:hypothetical protein
MTDLVIEAAHPAIWSSDRDAQGYCELEFRVVSGVIYDEQGQASEPGLNGCVALAERYAEYIED